MFELNLPKFEANIRSVGDHREIFDPLRRRFVALTAEEWVRQHFVNYLCNHLGYPRGLMANEVQLRLGQVARRADTVVYRRDLTVLMIVEYKAPTVAVSQKAFDQIINYSRVLHAGYLAVSNGLQHYCLQAGEGGEFVFMEAFPDYRSLI